MKHHETIAEMLKNRKNNSKDAGELELSSSFKKDSEFVESQEDIRLEESVELVESQEDISLEDSVDEDIELNEVDNLSQEEIEREKRILARWEKEKGSTDKRCPVCGSNLIDVGDGIIKCEKVTCTYSSSSRVKMRRRYTPFDYDYDFF